MKESSIYRFKCGDWDVVMSSPLNNRNLVCLEMSMDIIAGRDIDKNSEEVDELEDKLRRCATRIWVDGINFTKKKSIVVTDCFKVWHKGQKTRVRVDMYGQWMIELEVDRKCTNKAYLRMCEERLHGMIDDMCHSLSWVVDRFNYTM